ncbi:hypothetical protein ACS2TD_27090, partial [Bacillus cereus group sp. BC334]|uniref:hypothetical protein n=1 Tax=Bacillus cereus group sp. BC334 TaxID=3445305 RepID=UPI003F2336FE
MDESYQPPRGNGNGARFVSKTWLMGLLVSIVGFLIVGAGVLLTNTIREQSALLETIHLKQQS